MARRYFHEYTGASRIHEAIIVKIFYWIYSNIGDKNIKTCLMYPLPPSWRHGAGHVRISKLL